MFEVSDIVALAKAGFSAEQIGKLAAHMNTQPEPVQPPAPQPEPVQPEPVQPPAPQPEPVQPPAPQPAHDLDPILAALTDLKSAVQANGILASAQPPEPDEQDVLASILYPTHLKNNT